MVWKREVDYFGYKRGCEYYVVILEMWGIVCVCVGVFVNFIFFGFVFNFCGIFFIGFFVLWSCNILFFFWEFFFFFMDYKRVWFF